MYNNNIFKCIILTNDKRRAYNLELLYIETQYDSHCSNNLREKH